MIVFTVITGRYDDLKPIRCREQGVSYVCVTENLKVENNGWDVVDIKKLNPPEGVSKVLLQRWAKTKGAVEYFKEPTIYLDGSYEIVKPVSNLFSHLTKDAAFKRHPVRDCYMDEAVACIRLGKVSEHSARFQVSEYQSKGLETKGGMFETGVLIRNYNDQVLQFGRVWWDEIQKHTHRDQLSIMWVLKDSRLTYTVFEPSEFNQYVRQHKHK